MPCFGRFGTQGAPAAARKLHGLHGDRRGARAHAHGSEVLPQGAQHRDRVHAGVGVEPLVFDGDRRLGEP